ncbi:TPA: hypothetical protein ACTC1C_002060, partial [Neisseria meningitidis]
PYKNTRFRFQILPKNQPLPSIARITANDQKTSSFPRRRESRFVGAETYRVKRFLEILRSGFPLSWE